MRPLASTTDRSQNLRMDVKIRLATIKDCGVIADFNRFLAKETEDVDLQESVIVPGVSAILSDASKGLYFVAEENGSVLGQVMITYEWSDWRNGNIWWLQSVYVRKDQRGRGIFRQLFEHVAKLAKKEPGVCGIRLYMHNENHTARKTYKSLGFEDTAYQVLELPL